MASRKNNSYTPTYKNQTRLGFWTINPCLFIEA
jgi:hypothetical protein